jgi:hypothetical protein
LAAAVETARAPFRDGPPGALIIRSISGKQRARRRPSA